MFEALISVATESIVIWNIASCTLTDVHCRMTFHTNELLSSSGRKANPWKQEERDKHKPECGVDAILRDVSEVLPDDTALHTRRFRIIEFLEFIHHSVF
jgi:hypothetical protein